MKFENLVRILFNLRYKIFPYKDYAESYEIKNVSSLNGCKSIIA